MTNRINNPRKRIKFNFRDPAGLKRCNGRVAKCICQVDQIKSKMKTIVASLILTLIISTGFSQSKSFLTFKEKFLGMEDVHHFSINGFFTRAILRIVTEDKMNYEGVKDIKNIRVVTVPKAAFEKQNVTVRGFRREVKKDAFEELAHATGRGEDITLYIQSTLKEGNRYMILVDHPYEVILVEFRGNVDPNVLLKNGPLSFNKNE